MRDAIPQERNRSVRAPRRGATVGLALRRLLGAPAAALALAALVPAGSVAQEAAPPEVERPELAEEKGWRGSADLGFTATAGNSETTNVSVGLRVIHEAERTRWTLSGSFVRASTDGEETANKLDLVGKYEYSPVRRSFLFARLAGGFNKPAGIDRRIAPAAGVGYQPVESERVELSFEAGASWIQDLFEDGSRDEALYAALGQSLSLALASSTSLEQTARYEPKAADPGEFLLHAEVTLTTEITEALGLRVSFIDDYDSAPFVDPATGERRDRNDITFTTGVSFSF